MAQDVLTQAGAFAREGNLEALENLLSSSPAVLTARDSEGRTLLDLACCAATGDIAIPLHPGTPEQHAAVAMHLAAQYNCVGCLNLLLDRDADPTVVDGAQDGTPKGWAEFHGATDAVEILNRRVG